MGRRPRLGDVRNWTPSSPGVLPTHERSRREYSGASAVAGPVDPQGSPNSQRARTHRATVQRLLIFALAASLFGCDHATKIAAHAASLTPRDTFRIVGNDVYLRFAPNSDTAFSLLHRFGIPRDPTMLVLVASLALAGLLGAWLVARRHHTNILTHTGFAIVVAGAIGNVTDRAVRGYVVDFIHVYGWPVFNVADVLVVIGTLMILFTRSRPLSKSGVPA